jgi:hypothetical protein
VRGRECEGVRRRAREGESGEERREREERVSEQGVRVSKC